MTYQMKCFYYKWVNKKTGEVVLSNFDWAENFEAVKVKNESRMIACIEITHEEFTALRAKMGQ